jgi:hypothetical protein
MIIGWLIFFCAWIPMALFCFGLLWMMGGVGLRWKDYAVISIAAVLCACASVWLIGRAVSYGL